MTAHRILVVDDDPHIAAVIGFAVERAGMSATLARDGSEALSLLARGGFDLVVLDVGLPERDGLDVCREIRRGSDMPILFVSARDEEVDRVLGLELGGDDYVTKPFSPRELVARIRSILKRAGAPRASAAPYRHGGLLLDLGAHRARFGDATLPLTGLEFAILAALIRRPNLVLTRERVFEEADRGEVHVSDRTIDSHVRNLRAKLAAAGCDDAIETVHGIGFRLGPCGGRP